MEFSNDSDREKLLLSLPKYQDIYLILKGIYEFNKNNQFIKIFTNNWILNIILDVKEVVLPSSIKAMLATFLLNEWENSLEQISALRMAVGLDTPNQIWKIIGESSNEMNPRDKINFLAHIISSLNKRNKFHDKILSNLSDFLPLLIKIISEKFTGLEMRLIQQIAAEFVICDYMLAEISLEDRRSRIINFIMRDTKMLQEQFLVKFSKRWNLL
jgi:hypothetical protein